MDFKEVPKNYKNIVLSKEELTDAVEGWLRREHPGVKLLSEAHTGIVLLTEVDVLQRTRYPHLEKAREAKVEKNAQKKTISRKRLNAGIGEPLRAIFRDGEVHTVTELYNQLKPSFPHLTRKKLQHNFYAIKGVQNLGDGNWQQAPYIVRGVDILS